MMKKDIREMRNGNLGGIQNILDFLYPQYRLMVSLIFSMLIGAHLTEGY